MIPLKRLGRYFILLCLYACVLTAKKAKVSKTREAIARPVTKDEDVKNSNGTCTQLSFEPNDLEYIRSELRSGAFKGDSSYIYEIRIAHKLVEDKLDAKDADKLAGIFNGTYYYGISMKAKESFGLLKQSDFQTLLALNYVSIENDRIFILSQPAHVDNNSLDTTKTPKNYLSLVMQANKLHEHNKIEVIDFYIYQRETDCKAFKGVIRPPDIAISMTEPSEMNDGIAGFPSLELKWPDSHVNKYFFSAQKTKPNFYPSLCKLMGYREGKKTWKRKETKPLNSTIDFSNNCPTFFMSYFTGDDKSKAKMYKNMQSKNANKREKLCYAVDTTKTQRAKRNILYLECSKKMEASTALTQQTCGKGKCLLGYHAKQGTCAPNICHCPNGKPAISNYDYLDQICGYTAAVRKIPAMEEESDDPNSGDVLDDEEDDDEDGEDEVEDGDEVAAHSRERRRSLRLAGAAKAKEVELPFQAFLYASMASTDPHCSSAILNPRFVISAAHCCYEAMEAIPKIFVTERHIPGVCREHPKYVHPKPTDTKVTPFDIARVAAFKMHTIQILLI